MPINLRELVKDIYPGKIPSASASALINDICVDSRKVQPGSLFVAIPGAAGHGQQFIQDAITRGAKAVVVAKDFPLDSFPSKEACLLPIADPVEFLKDLLRRFYGEPSSHLRVVGVTGTNGKTTITYLLESIIHAAGKQSGVIGTVNYRYRQKEFPAKNTTPGIVENQQLLARMLEEKVDYCVMEVSSHALVQGRVDLIDFRSAIFTNLTSDHLDYHRSREEYFLAKSLLFTRLTPKALAVINCDDEFGPRLVKMSGGVVKTYGLESPADITARDIRMDFRGTKFRLVCPLGEISIETTLVGKHNVYNILAAVGACLNESFSLEILKAGIEKAAIIPGRLERIECGQPFHVFVDYAHTEDALQNVLTSLRHVSQARMIVVFGCGGDRDKTKRPRMGRVVSELADEVIITNDNPRSEDPRSIVDQIIPGCVRSNYRVVLDRQQAIKEALAMAQPGDIILIAGKGHEDYQIFKDRTVSFNEREVVRNILRQRQGVV